MLISAKEAGEILPKLPFVMGFLSGMDAVMLLVLPLRQTMDSSILIFATLTFSVSGLLVGVFIKYKSNLNAGSAIYPMAYLLTLLTLFTSSACALPGLVRGEVYLAYSGALAGIGVSSIFLLMGWVQEKKFTNHPLNEVRPGGQDKYIDCEKMEVNPKIRIPAKFINLENNNSKTRSVASLGMIGGALAANVMLVARVFGIDYNTMAWLAAVSMILIAAYIQLKFFGPSAFRLYQLHMLQKNFSQPLKNSDYEKIQDLRRTFFLSRWLMKDYRPTTGNRQAS
ncbi:hypothetical protein FAZ95_00435 [Trinickia violacea]|uniref:Uncharacterized protein n=1 Tax=Trinickia violacea TaxID=2571746 RepID=A0A4P8IPE4_9BURK|nr:hypothetical protein [Trinickia violacea]QCP47779.1 hypothetical protein FAZ95_00435 [Trinickia violacea]